MTRSDVHQFYASGFEAHRLQRGVAQLEAVRTRQLLERFLPAAPARVVDVGGGAGAHAFWLAKRGYAVDLLDPVPELIEAARAENKVTASQLTGIAIGDAVALPFANASADAVLLLGPLYHLTDVDERRLALDEARRVLRPGGILIAAAITRWAGALYGLSRDLYSQPGFAEMVSATVATGQNRNPAGLSGGFMAAYYHRPDELRDEIEAAGFQVTSLHGIEGPSCLLPDFDARWADAEQRKLLEWSASTMGDEPSLLGASAHLLAVAQSSTTAGTP